MMQSGGILSRLFWSRRAARLGIRTASVPMLLRLLDRANSESFAYRGAKSWVDVRSGIIDRIYVIPSKERAERDKTLVCIVLVLDARNRLGWMRLSVRHGEFCGLGKANASDQNTIALSLAMRGTRLESAADELLP